VVRNRRGIFAIHYLNLTEFSVLVLNCEVNARKTTLKNEHSQPAPKDGGLHPKVSWPPSVAQVSGFQTVFGKALGFREILMKTWVYRIFL
jgi:hypothetical protein